MEKKIKAALLSAFILPGLGQLYLGRRGKAAVLVALVTVALLIFVITAFLVIQDVTEAAKVSGEIDPVAVGELLRGKVPMGAFLGGLFLCIWIYGIVDAFLGHVSEDGADNEK